IAVPFIDFLLLSLSVILGVYVRFGTLDEIGSFTPVILMYGAISMFFLNYFGNYGRYKFSAVKSIFAVLGGFLVIAGLLFFFKQYAYSRIVVLLGGAFSLVLIPGWRLVFRAFSRTGFGPLRSTLGRNLSRNTLIVGDLESGGKLIKKLRSQIDSGYRIAGLVSINGVKTDEAYEGIDVCGSVDDLSAIIDRNNIEEVIFSTDRLSYDRILSLITRLGSHRVNFKLVPSNLEVVIGKASIDRIDDMPLLELDYKLHKLQHRAVKRIFDFVLAAFLAILTSPIVLFATMATKKAERRQIQGYGAQTFLIREYSWAKSRLIRKIPQLWSVVRGDLSLVGREMVDSEAGNDDPTVSEQHLKPGMTGLAQVNRSKKLSPEDKERYHIFYMKNYSVLLDLEIMFKALFIK
ncbi:sugar transferase, partial [bacterium]|nr:sugar transferase [bacterium]